LLRAALRAGSFARCARYGSGWGRTAALRAGVRQASQGGEPIVIGKIRKGSNPGPLMRYLYREDEREEARSDRRGDGRGDRGQEPHRDPRLIAGSIAVRDDPVAITRELREAAAANPGVNRPVFHSSLRVRSDEAHALDDAGWGEVAERYAEGMGFRDAAWVAVRHGEDHIHFVGSRVDHDGRVVSSHNDFKRQERTLRGIERDRGLEPAVGEGSRQPKRNSTLSKDERQINARERSEGRPGPAEAPRVRMRGVMERCAERTVQRGGTLEDYERSCAREGVTLRTLTHNANGEERKTPGYLCSIQGWERGGEPIEVSATHVHRELSWGRVGASLERDSQERSREREDLERGMER